MSARKASVKQARSNLDFWGIVELVDGDYPRHLYKKFYGAFRGTKRSATRPKFPPPPEGVIEHTSAEDEPIEDGSIIRLADGRLMLAQGNGMVESVDRTTCRFSENGGLTWSKARTVDWGMGVSGMLRLASGALAMYGRKTRRGDRIWFALSQDEGQTWSEPTPVPTHPDFRPM